MTRPGVICLGGDRFRVVGGDLAPGWELRPGCEAWCEVTAYRDGTIGSFRGELWPAAWPTFFHNDRPTAQVPLSVRLTATGYAAFETARRVYVGDLAYALASQPRLRECLSVLGAASDFWEARS